VSLQWVRILIAIAISLPTTSWSHGGGLDSQGGHNDRQADVYHFHAASGSTATDSVPNLEVLRGKGG
jgi:hypothetical protein